MEEKETKIIKERVKSAETAKIERVEEEIADELMPLKSQLGAIQATLNQLESSGQQSMGSTLGQNQQQPKKLLQQMEQFSSQAQQQQQKTFQQLQQTIHQTTQMLGNVEQSLQSFNMLNQITQQINQS
jgi:tRNA U34 5-carboxymethylaminomethyl modifying GTPase MnmE/TrmE